MATLTNNQTLSVIAGDYVIKTSGALDLQLKLDDEAFSTVTGGSFATASDGVMTLPICIIKCANAGASNLIVKKV